MNFKHGLKFVHSKYWRFCLSFQQIYNRRLLPFSFLLCILATSVHSFLFSFLHILATSVITDTFYSRLSSLVICFLQQAKYWYNLSECCCQAVLYSIICSTQNCFFGLGAYLTNIYCNRGSLCDSGHSSLLTVETTYLNIVPLDQF